VRREPAGAARRGADLHRLTPSMPACAAGDRVRRARGRLHAALPRCAAGAQLLRVHAAWAPRSPPTGGTLREPRPAGAPASAAGQLAHLRPGRRRGGRRRGAAHAGGAYSGGRARRALQRSLHHAHPLLRAAHRPAGRPDGEPRQVPLGQGAAAQVRPARLPLRPGREAVGCSRGRKLPAAGPSSPSPGAARLLTPPTLGPCRCRRRLHDLFSYGLVSHEGPSEAQMLSTSTQVGAARQGAGLPAAAPPPEPLPRPRSAP
jgi:hypothetical protein